jgi:hypothetical protein
MVQSLAMAVAQGQLALDKSSLQTARALAAEEIMLIEELHEIIEYKPPTAVEYTKPNGDKETIMVTGVHVAFEHTPPARYTLLQAGIFPTFYQFTESIIEVKMSISSKTTSGSEFEAGATLGVNYGPVSFAAHVNFKSSNTYSYSVEGSSLLRTTLKPVPPPARLSPRIITVNTLPLAQGQPAIVTTG